MQENTGQSPNFSKILEIQEIQNAWEPCKDKITRDENGEDIPHLEITEVVLVHCNIVNNYYQHMIQQSSIYLFVINHLVNY